MNSRRRCSRCGVENTPLITMQRRSVTPPLQGEIHELARRSGRWRVGPRILLPHRAAPGHSGIAELRAIWTGRETDGYPGGIRPMRARHRYALFCSTWLLAVVTACGSDDSRRQGGPGAGGGIAAGGAAAGAAGAGGSFGGASSGGMAGTLPGGAAGNGAAGTTGFVCPTTGMRLAAGACYIPCTYAPGSPPRYESPAGHCTDIGWRCSAYQYCDPNIHCTADNGCQTLGGPGLVCVPSGPLVGECLIRCTTTADCPNSSGATASPYVCQPIDTGSGIIRVCGF